MPVEFLSIHTLKDRPMKKTEIMKLLFLATCFLVCSCLVACDEGDPAIRAISSADFVGTWAGHSNSTTSCNTAVNNAPSQPCSTQCNSYTFTKTTFKFTTKFGSFEGAYTVKGDSVLMPALAQMGLSKRTFKLEGNNLTLSSKDPNAGCITNSVYVK